MQSAAGARAPARGHRRQQRRELRPVQPAGQRRAQRHEERRAPASGGAAQCRQIGASRSTRRCSAGGRTKNSRPAARAACKAASSKSSASPNMISLPQARILGQHDVGQHRGDERFAPGGRASSGGNNRREPGECACALDKRAHPFALPMVAAAPDRSARCARCRCVRSKASPSAPAQQRCSGVEWPSRNRWLQTRGLE